MCHAFANFHVSLAFANFHMCDAFFHMSHAFANLVGQIFVLQKTLITMIVTLQDT
jgi:hypothetical protein